MLVPKPLLARLSNRLSWCHFLRFGHQGNIRGFLSRANVFITNKNDYDTNTKAAKYQATLPKKCVAIKYEIIQIKKTCIPKQNIFCFVVSYILDAFLSLIRFCKRLKYSVMKTFWWQILLFQLDHHKGLRYFNVVQCIFITRTMRQHVHKTDSKVVELRRMG